MSRDYWLGVATPVAIFTVGYGLIWATANLLWLLSQRGWFMETGPAPHSEVTWNSRLVRRGRWGLYYGVYRTLSGWGSRWIAVGPITVGHKSVRLALTEKPPESAHTPRSERNH